jgi:class 3 adenylate cyclase
LLTFIYTPFTEDIIRRHKARGIAELVDALERMLIPVANAALNNRGNIIAVEGDALLVTFCTKEDVFSFLREVEPQRRATAKTHDKEYPLLLDIGVSHGSLYEFNAGDQFRSLYISGGSTIDHAYQAEDVSMLGNIAFNFEVPGSERSKDHFLLQPKDVPKPDKEGWLKSLFNRKTPKPDPFIPDEKIIAQLRSNVLPENAIAQLLSPVIVFSDFPIIRIALSMANENGKFGHDPEKAAQILNRFYLGVRDIVEVKGDGFIDKFKFKNSMFLFGAPKAFDDVRLRAFEAMSMVHEFHRKLLIEYNLPLYPGLSGMHKGDALCGEVLGRYTAIGNAVNVAARIKASSASSIEGGEIHDDQKRIRFSSSMLTERTARMIKGYEVDRVHLKGLDTRTIFGFSRIVEFSQNDDFILRDDELADLIEIARLSIERNGALVNLKGDSGCGRDRLLSLFADKISDEYECHEIRCSPFYKKDPYRTLFELLKKVYPVFTDEDLFIRTIGKRPESGAEFDAMLKKFRQTLASTPSAYLINNGDNIDRESADFFAKHASEIADSGSMLVYSGTHALFEEGREITLSNLGQRKSVEFAKLLAEKFHPRCEISDHVALEIFSRSEGNPLHISELVKLLKPEFGKLKLKGDISGDLKNTMLRNFHENLDTKMQAILHMYSLMHSVPTMAPLLDANYQENMALLQEKGFLGSDYEFSSELMKDAVSESMHPSNKQKLAEKLAQVAHSTGMGDHRIIFDYYSQAQRTPENRLMALEHADKYINETGFLYLIPENLMNEAIELADENDVKQRHILGMMLYRKAIYLNAQYADDMHKDKVKRMQSLVEIAKKSEECLAGHKIEYKALLQSGMALSYLAYFKKLEGSDPKEISRMFDESKTLVEQSRKLAYEAKDAVYYLAASSSFSHSLTFHQDNPGSAYLMLKDTESTYKKIANNAEDKDIMPRVANMYMNQAEAALMMKDYLNALDIIKMSLDIHENIDYVEGLGYSLGIKAKILAGLNDMWEARELAMQTLKLVEGKDILGADFITEMKKIVEDAERLKGGVSGQIA